MLLSELVLGAPEITINSLMIDSRKKSSDALFFCIKGMANDGHLFIDQAISNGAVAIVYSENLDKKVEGITYIQVDNVRVALAYITNIFYDDPSKKLKMFGVTGTNGKSSIAKMIKYIYSLQAPCGYIGTISIEYGSVKKAPKLTTPDVVELQSVLHDMVLCNMKACALEVSSIGLEQHRVDGIDFDCAIFTNLTHDHLDYHGNMESYFSAKRMLFQMIKSNGLSVINIDDNYGRRLIEDAQGNVITYGTSNDASYRFSNIKQYNNRTTFNLTHGNTEYFIETNLLAMFNVYNLVAVIVSLHESGMDMEVILEAVKHIPQIEGRMEYIDEGQNFNVIVDFAHTPDGIEQVMKFASSITPKENRIIAVFGSAGKRDVIKRPIFGEIADKYCDLIILTEDDPRDESVEDIAKEIAKGIKQKNYIIITRRIDAIRQAIELANAHDTILLLGKGDENFLYAQWGKEKYLGDNVVARQCIKLFGQKN